MMHGCGVGGWLQQSGYLRRNLPVKYHEIPLTPFWILSSCIINISLSGFNLCFILFEAISVLATVRSGTVEIDGNEQSNLEIPVLGGRGILRMV